MRCRGFDQTLLARDVGLPTWRVESARRPAAPSGHRRVVNRALQPCWDGGPPLAHWARGPTAGAHGTGPAAGDRRRRGLCVHRRERLGRDGPTSRGGCLGSRPGGCGWPSPARWRAPRRSHVPSCPSCTQRCRWPKGRPGRFPWSPIVGMAQALEGTDRDPSQRLAAHPPRVRFDLGSNSGRSRVVFGSNSVDLGSGVDLRPNQGEIGANSARRSDLGSTSIVASTSAGPPLPPDFRPVA